MDYYLRYGSFYFHRHGAQRVRRFVGAMATAFICCGPGQPTNLGEKTSGGQECTGARAGSPDGIRFEHRGLSGEDETTSVRTRPAGKTHRTARGRCSLHNGRQENPLNK